nr:hypothetical protein Iba_chr12cCG18010 [Ipomoea batatas]
MSFKLDPTCSSGGDGWNFLMICGSFFDREDALEDREESGKPPRRNPLGVPLASENVEALKLKKSGTRSRQYSFELNSLWPWSQVANPNAAAQPLPPNVSGSLLSAYCVRGTTVDDASPSGLHPADDESTTGQPSPPPPIRLAQTTAQPAGSRLQSRSPAPPSPQPAAADDEEQAMQKPILNV